MRSKGRVGFEKKTLTFTIKSYKKGLLHAPPRDSSLSRVVCFTIILVHTMPFCTVTLATDMEEWLQLTHTSSRSNNSLITNELCVVKYLPFDLQAPIYDRVFTLAVSR